MTHLGLVSISFRQWSAEEIIKEVKKAGLSCIEWGSDVHAPCKDKERLRNIAKRQKEAGIFCCSYGTYFRLGVHETKELLPYIEAAKILGTDILRLWCGDKGSAEYTAEELEVLYRQCREAARLAWQYNVTLCMECHNNTLTDSKEAALALMKAVDSPHFRMYWQPNQWRTDEENVEYVSLLSDYTKHIHVFYWKENDRFLLEEAATQWKTWLKVFEVVEMKGKSLGDRALLLEFMPDDRMESLEREACALRQIAREWL